MTPPPRRLASSSGGLNGTAVLNAQTVARDGALSQLVGGTSQEWFWFAERAASADPVNGWSPGDVATLE
jgi:hypothetical protein